MKCFAQISIAVLALGAVWLGGATHASAQSAVDQKNIPSYVKEQADVREAIRSLFREVNVAYTIAPEVQGVVTVSLKNVSFEIALQNVLRQVDATYRIEGGVYEIVHRFDPGPSPVLELPSPQPQSQTAMTVDRKFLYVVKGTEIFKLDKDTLRLIQTGSLNQIAPSQRKK